MDHFFDVEDKADKMDNPQLVRATICPRCGDSVVQCRYTGDYCEECGWPDEDFSKPD